MIKKERRTRPLGWDTTDKDEIARRIERARKETFKIKRDGEGNTIFCDWVVVGEENRPYRVEIRSLSDRINSCGCKDFQISGLGICKHIEAALNELRKRKKQGEDEENPAVELYIDGSSQLIQVLYPAGMRSNRRIRQVVGGFFDTENRLRGDPLQSIAKLKQQLAHESPRVRHQLRISTYLEERLSKLQQQNDQRKARRRFEDDLKQGRASLDVLKQPLYPYQQEGMMHLAFTGRALLADEMGLGKTVQAIAGSELLNRLHPLNKVLVISPASLKSEWAEQIAQFSPREVLIIQGARKNRRKLYHQPAFFYLANYEQILHDGDFINQEFQPDLIILDEAQRIKNWQTKTAGAIKRLESPYAFVLTGTPLENRIDEIFSIVQFLDPTIFGPLFRFNREFHQLDDKGQAVGYRNLDQLHEKIQPIMLRRRKQDVEGELPERSIKNFFVAMTPGQNEFYQESEQNVARLGALAKKRPLTKKERDLLMISLGCMRMACDSAFILDQQTRLSPKLDELERLVEEIYAQHDGKIIVFSEWERMLILLAERLQKRGIEYAWHTGSINQTQRRQQINRFKNDPDCGLFLATDSAATGLNLQVARVVINLDLPWNPAKLEQRIARAWRKHQKHPVSVINLIAENTIEHRMLDVLRHKTDLADAVVDGALQSSDMEISGGRAGLIERLDEILSGPVQRPSRFRQLTQSLLADYPDRLEHFEQRGNTLLTVVDNPDKQLTGEVEQRIRQLYGDNPPQLEMIDPATFDILQRLAEAGVIQFTQPNKGEPYPASNDKQVRQQQQLEARVKKHLDHAKEKQRMSRLLFEGGFVREAVTPMNDALNEAMLAAVINSGDKADGLLSVSRIEQLQSAFNLPQGSVSTIAALRHEAETLTEEEAARLMDSAGKIISVLQQTLAAATG